MRGDGDVNYDRGKAGDTVSEQGGGVSIDRTYEYAEPDSLVVVTLEDGFQARFFLHGLSDYEYIQRTRQIRSQEEKLKLLEKGVR